jgi:RNA polymerase sigma factor (sigma-70 family)
VAPAGAGGGRRLLAHRDPEPQSLGPPPLYTPPHQAPGLSAESAAVLGEERLQVQRALQGLPTRTREVLVLRYYLDLPFAEIAALLGIAESSARSTSTRGLATLTERLKDIR